MTNCHGNFTVILHHCPETSSDNLSSWKYTSSQPHVTLADNRNTKDDFSVILHKVERDTTKSSLPLTKNSFAINSCRKLPIELSHITSNT